MNIVDIIGILFVVIFVWLVYRSGVVLAIGSLIGIAASLVLAELISSPLLNFIQSSLWRENIYTPILVFIALAILIWAVFFTISTFLPIPESGRAASIFAALIWGLNAIIIFTFFVLALPKLSAAESARNTFENSLFSKTALKCSLINKMYFQKTAVFEQISSDSILLSQNKNETIKLEIDNSNPRIATSEINELYELINARRASLNLEPYEINPNLQSLAIAYAKQIGQNKTLSHKLNGLTVEQRAKAAKIDFDYIGENLALASTFKLAQSALIESNDHRKNLDSTVFRRVGVAVLKLPESGTIVVEEFSN